jgi:hypothetical protein
MKQDLILLNILSFLVVLISISLMILWSRATRGVWPGRKKLFLLSGVNLFLWVYANVMYFYFR